MARGTQHRKRRPAAHARAVAAPAAAKPQRKASPPQWQEQLFFQRLRTHAKWAYVALAAAFVLTFVFLGVGSGSSGISDALQNAFNFGSGGTSISSLQRKAAQHPNDAQAWRNLATAYEAKQDTAGAVSALERYTALRPKDTGSLGELAAEYSSLATTYQAQYTNAQLQAQAASPASVFAPPSSTPLGRAFANPNALQDPISNAVQQQATSAATSAYSNLQTTLTKAEAVYQKLAAADPTSATTQLQLGQAAQAANDTQTAIAAYTSFLKLAPTDPLASRVRQVLKALQPAKAAPKAKK